MINCVTSKPMVSVIMPVFNGEEHLREAIDSILDQTLIDFELIIIIEKGSNDESQRIVNNYKDKRIRIIHNKEKLGLPESLNEGIRQANGIFIARMDADDIAYKSRLEKQVKYMQYHEDVIILGANAHVNGNLLMRTRLPQEYEEIKFTMCLHCCIMHPVVMWRKSAFKDDNLYYANINHCEDYDLWVRAILRHKVKNLWQPLFFYRKDGTGKSAVTKWEEDFLKIRNRMINNYCEEFDILESFYIKSSSKEVFEEKVRCIKKIAKQFKFKDIRNVFTHEAARIFIINGVSKPNILYTYYRELYKKSDLLFVYIVFGVELVKNALRKMMASGDNQ